jgi:hypothetical protein
VEFKLDIGGSLPGEKLVTALLEWDTARRAGMTEENRALADKISLAMLRGWHNFWVSIGWPGEKV